MAKIITPHTVTTCIACPWAHEDLTQLYCAHPHFPNDIDNLITVNIHTQIMADCPLEDEVTDATIHPAS